MEKPNDLKVEKKDGRTEKFDRTKVLGSMLMAGSSALKAKEATKQVEKWAQENAKDSVISTSQIRIKVLQLLRDDEPDVADAFERYKKKLKIKD